MKKPILASVLLVAFSAVFAPSRTEAGGEVREEWVAHFDGPGNNYDEAVAAVTDDKGNIYVTGRIAAEGGVDDYGTVKYDPEGYLLWYASYNGPAALYDFPHDIAIGPEGRIYVTGESSGGTSQIDFATVAYDTDGNLLWTARKSLSWNNVANDVEVDSHGDVYVTGSTMTNVNDFLTVKYDSSGTELWYATYDGIVSFSDAATAMVLDDSGNVYVTGESSGLDYEKDLVVIKYDSSGTEAWVSRYVGPAGYLGSYPLDIALDEYSNVYVTGYWLLPDTGSDYLTIKLDPGGNLLWEATYNGTADGWDVANALAVHGSSVYVTGRSMETGSSRDFTTIKYDSDGTFIWKRRYNGPANAYDEATSIAVDEGGNVYVAGASNGGSTNFDMAVVKYDKRGNEIWTTRYDGPSSNEDFAIAVLPDRFAGVFAVGSSNIAGNNDFTVVKYAQGPPRRKTPGILR